MLSRTRLSSECRKCPFSSKCELYENKEDAKNDCDRMNKRTERIRKSWIDCFL